MVVEINMINDEDQPHLLFGVTFRVMVNREIEHPICLWLSFMFLKILKFYIGKILIPIKNHKNNKKPPMEAFVEHVSCSIIVYDTFM